MKFLIGLSVLSVALLTLAVLGSVFSTKLTLYALKRGKIQLWRIACVTANFYSWFLLITVLVVVIAIELKTHWFSTSVFGELLGTAIGLGLFTTALWESFKNVSDTYRLQQIRSLDRALPTSKRDYFNRKKSILEGDNAEARKRAFRVLFGLEKDEEIHF